MKWFRKLGVFSFVVFAGCDLEMTPTLYVSQLLSPKPHFYAPLAAKFEVSSNETCNKEMASMKNLIKEHFKAAGRFICKDEQMRSWLHFTAHVLIAENISDSNDDAGLLALRIKKEQKDGVVYIVINRDALRRLNSYLEKKFFGKMEAKNLKISLHLDNNTDALLKVRASAVYWDGTPSPFAKTYSMPASSDADIRLSDVLRDSVYDGIDVPILHIEAPVERFKILKNPPSLKLPAEPKPSDVSEPEAASVESE